MSSSTTPNVYGPDGVLRDSSLFSTTKNSRFFTGTTSETTVDMEVSINGAAYTSDSDYVLFDGTTWTVPNPLVFPDGLPLDVGSNTILVRAISTSGNVSGACEIDVTFKQSTDVTLVAETPTGVTLDQQDGKVTITVDAPSDTTNFRGINFYASLYEGGGATGYIQINIEPVSDGETVEETTSVGSFEVDSDVILNPDGTAAADPLYAKYVGTQVNSDGTTLQSDWDQSIEVPETATRIRASLALSAVTQTTRYSFEHSRTATATSTPPTVSISAFAAAPVTDPLYYVVTAVYYNTVTLEEVESTYSVEVVGHPLTVSTTQGSFPVVTQKNIRDNVIEAILRSNRNVRVDPGSVLRDTFIDPFVAEATRIRFILDFLHRAQSFASLINVDDPQNTGTSVSVSTSAYKSALKKAFGLTSDTATQAVIDRAFESLASNYGIYRKSGSYAKGKVTFYTTKTPTKTIPIPLGATVGGGSVTFKTTEVSSLPLSKIASIYDPTTGRYRVTVTVQATTVGSDGNISAGQIRKVISGVSGLSVINTSDMFGGRDQETNRELATRAMNALASVDTGTARGYLQAAAGVPGVLQAEVVSAGDTLMIRDLDSAGVHRGGKVDVWVQGENLATVTDTFAFSREEARNIHFVVIGDPSNYIFQAVDSDLSQTTPIVEMLDNSGLELGLRNASTGEWFDLTGVTLLNYNTIQLSTEVAQPPVTLTDVVLGDYRRLTGNTFVFTRQPVREVTDVTGVVSGSLSSDAYSLIHPNDPLGIGLSKLAGDYLQITPISDGSGGYTPSGSSVSVTDEEHVLIGSYPEYLDSLGVDTLSIVVKSSDGLTTYRGPDDPSGVSDYTIQQGDETTAPALIRTTSGNIASGDTVLVSYDHDENFTVTYTTNIIVGVAQETIDSKRHVTADVVVKEAVEVPVDISATILLQQGVDQATVDTAIRTNLANFFTRRRLGDPVRQSDIVSIMDQTTGVSYVEVPLTLLVRQEGSMVVRESLSTDQAGDITYVSAWSSPTVSVWLLEDNLSSATTDGGGSTSEFRGVFADEVALTLLTAAPSTALKAGSARAYIIGSEGLAIPGISSDETLIAAGYTGDAIDTQRLALTANRVLVSTTVDDSPNKHAYTVCYIVGADTGSQNISASAAEYLSLGNVELTYDEDS